MNILYLKLCLFSFLLNSCNKVNAQDYGFLYNQIFIDKSMVVDNFVEIGFKLEDQNSVDGCDGFKLKNKVSSIIYNSCPENEFVVSNINIIDKNYEIAFKRLSEAKSDTTLSFRKSTMAGSTSYIFEDEYVELYFVFDHLSKIYVTEISNSSRFQMMKEYIEEARNYDYETDGIAQFRKMLNVMNSKGLTVEQFLKNSSIDTTFNILELDKSFDYLKEFRKSDKFDKLKKTLKINFLDDSAYVNSIRKAQLKMQLWFVGEGHIYDKVDEDLFKIAIEENRFRTVLFFKYIFEELELR